MSETTQLTYKIECEEQAGAETFAHLVEVRFPGAAAKVWGWTEVTVVFTPFSYSDALAFERYATNLLLARDYASPQTVARAAYTYSNNVIETFGRNRRG